MKQLEDLEYPFDIVFKFFAKAYDELCFKLK